MKKCTFCKQIKSLSNFWNDITRPDGLQAKCKYCEKEIRQHRRANNPDQTLGQKVKKYWPGLHPLDAAKLYMTLLAKQNGVCKICNLPETELEPYTKETKRLCVDHCHKTKTVRGLLCKKCNAALGSFQDSAQNLKTALLYLEKHGKI